MKVPSLNRSPNWNSVGETSMTGNVPSTPLSSWKCRRIFSKFLILKTILLAAPLSFSLKILAFFTMSSLLLLGVENSSGTETKFF